MTTRPPKNPPASPGGTRTVRLICAGLAAMVFLIFGQTWRNGFVNYDDDLYVYANPHISGGFTPGGVQWAFTSCQTTGNWHPLTWLSLMLDCQLYGLNPAGLHLTNCLLHALTVILLFRFLREATGALWPGAFTAAVFAFHPLRVESVAWIAERKDLLGGLFFMLAVFAYARYARKKAATGAKSGRVEYGLTLLFFALGLLSKPMVVTLPFVLLLLDYWPLQRFAGAGARVALPPLILEKIPLYLLTAAGCVVTYLTQQSAGAIAATPLGLRLENIPVSYVSYIAKMFWPEHLAVLYPFPDAVPVWQVAGAVTLLIATTLLAIRFGGRCRYFLIGWLWFLGMLVPVIGFVQVGDQAMADRFSYLPEVGLIMALVWGAADFIAVARLPRQLVGIAAAGVITILVICSLRQISHWHDSESLWRHTIASTAPNPVAQINLGLALMSEDHFDEAIGCFKKSIEISPSHPFAYLKLGVALVHQGRIDEAVADYRQALGIWPDSGQFHRNLAGLLFSQGHASEAIEQYQAAIRIDSGDVDAYKNLAGVLAQQGKPDEAITDYQRVVQLAPGFENHYNLGLLLAMNSRLDEAVDQFRTAIQLQPDSEPAHYLLGLALAKENKPAEAIRQFQETLRVNPKNDDAQKQLAALKAPAGTTP